MEAIFLFINMTTATDVLKIATRQIGYKESPPGTNQNKFGVWYGMNYQPWCAMFVSYCFYNSGCSLKITTPKGFAYCPHGVNWFKQQGRFDKHPHPGDVVFYDWRGDGVSDHVGIVEAVNSDGTITAIEGNTSGTNDSNGGAVMRRKRSLSTILGFGHPVFDGTPTSHSDTPPHPSWSRYITLTSPPTSGNDVVKWHQQMICRGWKLEGDEIGVFGPRSYEILKQFQQEKGLLVDGVLGPMSWNAAWELPIT